MSKDTITFPIQLEKGISNKLTFIAVRESADEQKLTKQELINNIIKEYVDDYELKNGKLL